MEINFYDLVIGMETLLLLLHAQMASSYECLLLQVLLLRAAPLGWLAVVIGVVCLHVLLCEF